ncbi:MAG: hypothetical protein H7842_13245 [Gammaproteobacteria bacterium SHHR-1]
MIGLEMVSFHLAGYPLAVQASQVGQMQALDDQAQANRQRLCQLLGLDKGKTHAPQQALLLHTAKGPQPCALDQPVELFPARAEQLLPLPPLLRAASKIQAVRGLLRQDQHLWLVLDLKRLDLGTDRGQV